MVDGKQYHLVEPVDSQDGVPRAPDTAKPGQSTIPFALNTRGNEPFDSGTHSPPSAPRYILKNREASIIKLNRDCVSMKSSRHKMRYAMECSILNFQGDSKDKEYSSDDDSSDSGSEDESQHTDSDHSGDDRDDGSEDGSERTESDHSDSPRDDTSGDDMNRTDSDDSDYSKGSDSDSGSDQTDSDDDG